jgi:hypothetical protein
MAVDCDDFDLERLDDLDVPEFRMLFPEFPGEEPT